MTVKHDRSLQIVLGSVLKYNDILTGHRKGNPHEKDFKKVKYSIG